VVDCCHASQEKEQEESNKAEGRNRKSVEESSKQKASQAPEASRQEEAIQQREILESLIEQDEDRGTPYPAADFR